MKDEKKVVETEYRDLDTDAEYRAADRRVDVDYHDGADDSELNTLNKRAGFNLSWRAIIAGVVTFLALMLLFMLIGNAIGFGVSDLTASNPLSGVGTGLIIWIIVSLVVSLGLAGLVAGLTANRAGFIHGFLTWAVSVISLFFLLSRLVSGALGVAGQALGYAGNAVGTVAEQAGTTVAGLTQDAFDQVANELNVDTSELETTVNEVLADTEIRELQPEYLQGQLDQTVQDITDAGYAIVVEGQDAQQVADKLTTTLGDRAENITAELDRDALVNSISNNTELTQPEVEQAADNIEEAYNEATTQAQAALDQASQSVDELTAQAEQALQEGTQVAEDVTNNVAKISLWTFVGLLLGLLITSFAGHYGSRMTSPFYGPDSDEYVKY
ncbi:hypothetical protein HZY86_07475 [Aerococcaceae bacterium DSM 111020]|nr:hypothetical protein [Aerococcaceae bacterium DSM 111020]